MNTLISCCGLNCEACEARIATITDDEGLRKATAEQWSSQYHASILPEMIHCTGCREPGVKIGHWQECGIRTCAAGKGFDHCGQCSSVRECKLVGQVHQHVPGALDNLLKISG